MPDIFSLLIKWRKSIFAVVFLSLLAAGIPVFLKPRQYLSTATAVPASSLASDKANIFNENIEALYSALGSPDDLDRILGTARLDTVYLAVTDQFNLFDHYKIDDKEGTARVCAASRLKKNSRVMKSEYGELKVRVWDTDRNLAAELANAILEKLQAIHSDLQNRGNQNVLNSLLEGRKKINRDLSKLADSLKNLPPDNANGQEWPERKKRLQDQLLQYEKLANEYELMTAHKPPVLLVVEPARAATAPDRPKRIQVLLATALLGFLFSLLVALVLEKRKMGKA